MSRNTNLQYADQLPPVKVPEEKHVLLHVEVIQKSVAAVHDFLTEKERYACNRATD